MWNILWNKFHICKSFKSCWIKSCYSAADQAAKRTRRNRSALVRDALREHLRRLELRAGEERDRQGNAQQRKPTRRRWVGNRRPVAGRIARSHIARGDVRLYEFAAPDKKRPELVLTRDSAIAYLSTVTVAPVTSTIRGVPRKSSGRGGRHEVHVCGEPAQCSYGAPTAMAECGHGFAVCDILR